MTHCDSWYLKSIRENLIQQRLIYMNLKQLLLNAWEYFQRMKKDLAFLSWLIIVSDMRFFENFWVALYWCENFITAQWFVNVLIKSFLLQFICCYCSSFNWMICCLKCFCWYIFQWSYLCSAKCHLSNLQSQNYFWWNDFWLSKLKCELLSSHSWIHKVLEHDQQSRCQRQIINSHQWMHSLLSELFKQQNCWSS